MALYTIKYLLSWVINKNKLNENKMETLNIPHEGLFYNFLERQMFV